MEGRRERVWGGKEERGEQVCERGREDERGRRENVRKR